MLSQQKQLEGFGDGDGNPLSTWVLKEIVPGGARICPYPCPIPIHIHILIPIPIIRIPIPILIPIPIPGPIPIPLIVFGSGMGEAIATSMGMRWGSPGYHSPPCAASSCPTSAPAPPPHPLCRHLAGR